MCYERKATVFVRLTLYAFWDLASLPSALLCEKLRESGHIKVSDKGCITLLPKGEVDCGRDIQAPRPDAVVPDTHRCQFRYGGRRRLQDGARDLERNI